MFNEITQQGQTSTAYYDAICKANPKSPEAQSRKRISELEAKIDALKADAGKAMMASFWM